MDRAEPVHEVILGEVIGGYRLDRLIGAGSTSKVFLGTHVLLGRTAAIKVLAPGLVSNKDVVARLLTEARVVNDIRHPNIIDIIDFVVTESPPRVALVMELIEGPSLKAMRESPLSYEQAIGVALQLVDAVSAAHAAGVIHRDIKPDNLLLTSDPRSDKRKIPILKIVDFGIAKLAGSSGKTVTGMMLGTPAYMAPEQVAGRPPPSAATDVFAIGEVLYEILTGERAYPAVAIHETVRAKLRGELPDLKLPSIPGDAALLAVIKKCLALKPTERPSVEDVKAVLLDVAPQADTFSSENSSRKSGRAAPSAAAIPAKQESVRQSLRAATALKREVSPSSPARESRSSVARVAPPLADVTADVAVFRAQQAAKVAEADQSFGQQFGQQDVTAENAAPITQPNPTQQARDEITDQGPRTDPLSKFAQVVLDHSETELDLSDQETRAGRSISGELVQVKIPQAAATEIMPARPSEGSASAAASARKKIARSDSSPTNVAMPGLTIAMTASPAPEMSDEPPGTEITVLGTRARRGLLAHAGMASDQPETQLALPRVTASEVVALEADTAELPDAISEVRLAQEAMLKGSASGEREVPSEVSMPKVFPRPLSPATPGPPMRSETLSRDAGAGGVLRDSGGVHNSGAVQNSGGLRDAATRENGPARDPSARDVMIASRDLASSSLIRDMSSSMQGSVREPVATAARSDLMMHPQRPVVRTRRRWLAVVIGVLWFVAVGMLILSLVVRRESSQPKLDVVPEQVKVSVNSKPLGARVEIAATGEHLGNTPVELSFPKDNVPRSLRLSQPGYDSVAIDISPSNARVFVELEPSTKQP